ncbi:hypothetical protein MH117_18900 [Paenibacillus sp. ACRRX]|uniref:hypothetical protein n=1 Tax=Paenibacillus sp. ACRRX TaxID=2918206 RepID=UPI001EF6A0F0|nr:hypothetical protein [Paenibacillus sp. ACRRX]MCG7409481.1 hypothetical protein [Paenibacillus sp. ACRRX]
MKKKLAIYIMTALLMLSVAIPASAASYTTNLSNINNDEITEVNPERTNKIEILYEERSRLIQSNDHGEKLAENQMKLEGLGVEFLSTNEVQQRFGNDAPAEANLNLTSVNNSDLISPYVNPPEKKNIVWKSYRADMVKNSVTYEVQHLTAESNSQSSSLKGTTTAVVQTSSSFGVAVEKLIFTVCKAGASTVSNGVSIAISFYDALKSFISDANFKATTTVDNVKVTYQTNQYQSIDYMYVKVKSKNDNTQVLSFVTNEVSGDTTAIVPIFKYGANGATSGSSSSTINRQFSYKAPKHRDSAQAVASYLDPVYQPGQSFLNELQVTGIKGAKVHFIPMTVVTLPGSLN